MRKITQSQQRPRGANCTQLSEVSIASSRWANCELLHTCGRVRCREKSVKMYRNKKPFG